MTSIDTRIADAPLGGVKHSLRSATRGAEEQLEEEALMQEEEKMMDDEIFSEDDDSDGIEGRSSSEGPDGFSKRSGDADDDESSHHYGLRKRRRQSGSDLERLEMFQCSKAGGLAKSTKPKPAPAAGKAVLSPASKAMPPPGARSSRKSKGGGQKALDFSDDRLLNHKDISLVPNPLSDLEKVADSLFDDVVVPTDKRKVTISSQPKSGRKRGYSIDSLGGLSAAFSDDNSSHAAAVSDGPGRDRTFSFECFNFGINEDEPLPPLEATSAHMAASADSHIIRPRGDSIIFDPVSFQDGGIHEQSALYSIDDIPVLPSTSRPPVTAKPPSSAKPPSHVIASRPAVTHASPSSSASTVPSSSRAPAPANTVSFSMELLNRDGRIGIYLPEARRARIARFLAKRQRRVWRKRIKYDCRKKLADSRPRIKGRFVKRAENEE